ncbi:MULTISPECIES: hypothetical protein [Streptomyces]|uniref:Uncharacterized protein n=1 Tax=Streptomyces bacillaris TaxID=68179 RepID=A0ABW6E4J1_9ACTN|nr:MULTISPECIES: hypothetical protein [Streptomyces]ONI49476.1 hypothetical protein STIB_65660 [Streptomyces sp. IB2014 011-1]
MGRMRTGEFMLAHPELSPKNMVRHSGSSLIVGNADKGDRLRVKLVDGWEEDGNWGGYLQITRGDYKGYYLDSKDGWVHPYSSKYDPITFVDKGDWYEIRQTRDLNGSALITEGDTLRFRPSTPGHWHILDS